MSVVPTVAVCVASPKTIIQDIERVCSQAGLLSALPRDEQTLLLSELQWRYPLPSLNTTPWQLDGAIRATRPLGKRVSVRTCFRSLAEREAAELHNLGIVERHHGLEVRCLNRMREVNWMEYRPKCKMHVLQGILPDGILLPNYLFGKNLFSLPTVKLLGKGTLWGAIMASLSLLGKRAPRAILSSVEAAVDLLAIQAEVNPNRFWLMDATTIGVGSGLKSVEPREANLLLASSDPVALDTIAAQLLGLDPKSDPAIRHARERGLGVGDPAGIRVVGEACPPLHLAASKPGLLGRIRSSQPGTQVLSRLNSTLAARSAASLASGLALYDNVWGWRRRGEQVYTSWRKNTPWGELFSAYESGRQLID